MNHIVVIKCGGRMVEELSDHFFTSIMQLKREGYAPVIVHGGGPAIHKMLARLDMKSEFADGLRKTDEQMMEIVEMVLCGSVNKALVKKFGQAGLKAVGLSGCDDRLIEAVPRDQKNLGYVGDVSDVNRGLLMDFLEQGIVPIIAPIGISESEHSYNINADTAAAAIAVELAAHKLLFVTDVPGILKNDQWLDTVNEDDVRHMIEEGTIHGGMIPKVEAALESLHGQLKEVMIVDGKYAGLMKDGKIHGTAIQKSEAGEVLVE